MAGSDKVSGRGVAPGGGAHSSARIGDRQAWAQGAAPARQGNRSNTVRTVMEVRYEARQDKTGRARQM